MSFPGRFELNASDNPNPSLYNSFLRRPWSPLRYDVDDTDNRGTYDYLAQEQIPGSLLREGRRARRVKNASEDSVEALDLADYARTLRGLTTERSDPYPPFPYTSHVHPLSVPTPAHASRQPSPLFSYPEYPSSPDNNRPFSAQSRDTFNQAPPSLVSGDTSYDTHESYGSPQPHSMRRPYSLPPFLASASANHLPTHDLRITSALSDSPHSAVRIASPGWDELDEVDISRFPSFSRGWYDDLHKSNTRKHSSLPPYSSNNQYDHAGSFKPFPSTASNQPRSMLPWDSQAAERHDPSVDDVVKEERIRMLEHEFGKKGVPRDSGERMIGSVDEKGTLITAGPKRRATARWAQGLFALTTAVSSLYGALFIKSPTPAPPASKPPAFALYIFSVVTFFFTFYLFALRPCCCGKRRKSTGPTDPKLAGMMVLPVQGLPGGKKKKKKKGKSDKGGGGGGDVQVNLIVDPSMFSSGRNEGYESEGDYDFDGSQDSSRRREGHNQGQQRRGIFQGLAMESDWKAARKFVKRMLFADIACFIAWTGIFILVLFGKKCPPGGFNGWCDSYNIASASACILCVAFGFSAYFDMIDLHKSKVSPRTRT